MGCFILILVTFLLAAPQYFIIAFHQTYYMHQFGGGPFNLIYIVIAIIFGLMISYVLSKYVLGTFVILFVGSIIFTLCCYTLAFGSWTEDALFYWYSVMLIMGFAIGLVQPNNAAIYGDQVNSNSIIHFYWYVLVHNIAMGLAVGASHSSILRKADTSCPIMNCYSFVYLVCMVSSSVASFLLLLICIMKNSVFVIRPLIQRHTFNLKDSKRNNVFALLMIPLSVNFIVFFLLDNEWPKQASNMNPNVGEFFIQEIHMHAFCTIISILCLTIAILMLVGQKNRFLIISLSCLLICFTSFYMGQLYYYMKDVYLVAPVVNSDSFAVILFNGEADVQFDFVGRNVRTIFPFHSKIGPYDFHKNNWPIIINELFLTDLHKDLIQLDLTNVTPGNTICFWYTAKNMPSPYVEIIDRQVTGLVLLRILFNTVFSVGTLCLKSLRFDKCIKPGTNTLMQVPSGVYSFIYNNKKIGEFVLGTGGYFTILISSKNITGEDVFLTPFTIIPPFNLNVIWQVVTLILLSLAKVLCFGAGLHIAYLIGRDNQKSVFISCLYSVFLGSWVLYRFIDIRYGFDIGDKFDIVTFISALATACFFCGHHIWGHLLNRNEDVN